MGRLPISQKEALLVGLVVLGSILTYASGLILSHGPTPALERFPVLEQDSSEYALLADNLLQGNGFTDSADHAPFRKWAIGYPLFLALSKALSGSFVPAISIQVLLLALATVLIFRMSRRVLPEHVAVVPALFFGLNPYVLFLNTVVLSDGLFASLLVIIVYCIFFSEPKKLRSFVAFGFLLGVATLIRPIAQFLVVLFPLLLFFLSGISKKRALFLSGALIIGFALIVTPWVARNYIVFKTPEIAHIAQFDLLYYNAQSFLVMKELRAERPQPVLLASSPLYTADAKAADKRVSDRIEGDLKALVPIGGNAENYYGLLGARYILSDPLYYAYFHLVSTVSYFFTGDLRAYQTDTRSLALRNGYDVPVESLFLAWNTIRTTPTLAERVYAGFALLIPALELCVSALLILLSLAALALSDGTRRRTALLFAALIAYFALITGPIGIGTARLHIPTEPYLFMLAGIGAISIFPLLQQVYAHRFEFIRFFVSGTTATLLQVFLMYVLTEFVRVPYLLSASFAMLIAYGASFVLQKHWSFKNQSGLSAKRQLSLYIPFIASTIALNAALLWFLVHELFLWYVFAQLIVAVIIALLSYGVYKRFLFGKEAGRS